MFIPDSGSRIRLFRPGSRVDKIPDLHQIIFYPKTVAKFSNIRPQDVHPGSWIWIFFIPDRGFRGQKASDPLSFLRRSLTCLNLAAAASGLGYAVITTIPNTLITMYHEEPELYYGSHSARAGVGEDIAILDSGYFLSQVLPSPPSGICYSFFV
jgi:hypothetical protein